ncbi:MAG TPA: hypothetical protein VGP61_06740 [Gemmatimonadales bacterium]|jgi:hypothetical protein|nr:hypothetical protein [Gemmatimonadales bacterium]
MEDKELERRLGELKETWRVPPRDPPLDAIWQAIELRAFPATPRPGRWSRRLLPLAATLVLGFGLGQLVPSLLKRHSAPALSTVASLPPAPTEATRAPFVGIATDYLERVTGLLVSLTDATQRGRLSQASSAQARDLLATTRLLLDSPQASDPHLQELLADLELVLAQIVRLPRRASPPDVYLIDQALDQREVLPRLRGLLAENSTSQP